MKMAATGAEVPGPCWVPCLCSLDTLRELCREGGLLCKSIGVTRGKLSSYEVEYLCDYKVVDRVQYYLVKWRGWPESQNSWEPLRNLRGALRLRQFHQDKDTYLSQANTHEALVPRGEHIKVLQPAIADYILKRARQRVALQRWQDDLNRGNHRGGRLFVENTVDWQGPPLHFHYIHECKPAPGIPLGHAAASGCSCRDCFRGGGKCCPTKAGGLLAYNRKGHLRVEPGVPIYECNSRCRCGPACPNRIVQKGTRYPLCIFRTSNGCGWGVKTLVKIARMRFVTEYVGEVITNEEAERRGQMYDSAGITYLFDLDFDSEEFTVDAARYGNVSRFINHSCDPNLQVFNVFIETRDTRLPRIALFSTRSISAGEELTFDYQMNGSGDPSPDHSPAKKRIRTECKCGAANCRGYLN